MSKKLEDEDKDKKIDEILRKHKTLDDICVEIFFTLMTYKRLRFNELNRYLKKFGTDISNPALIDHLNHLKKEKLINRKREGQSVSYGLTEEINSLLHVPEEDVKAWVENFIEKGKKFGLIPLNAKEYYNKLTEQQLDVITDNDLSEVLRQNLFELKTYINYDLKLNKPESHAVFWNFIGNPIYRMLERHIVENCRNSEKYKNNLFEKMDLLINNRELLRGRSKKS